jgi:uncharacterized protein YceK
MNEKTPTYTLRQRLLEISLGVFLIALLLLTSGCGVIPQKHDGSLVSHYVEARYEFGKLNCDRKEEWSNAYQAVAKLQIYADTRADNNAANIKAIKDNLDKAKATKSTLVCQNYIKLTEQRFELLEKVYKNRW